MGLRDFFQPVRDFSTQLRACHDEITNLDLERFEILSGPVARADIKELMERWIDSCGDRYQEMLQRHMTALLRKAELCQDLNSPQARNLLAVVAVPPVGNPATPGSVDVALMALLGPQIKGAVLKAIDKLDWPTPEGLCWKEREAKVAEIIIRLEKLKAKKVEMIAAARENGLVVDIE